MSAKRVKGMVGVAAALVALAALILWMMGGIVAEHTASIVIPAPPERIFPYLTDPDRLVRWIGGLQKSEPLTAGGLRVGARSREIVEENGRRMEMETVVTRLEPDRLLEVKIENPMFEIMNGFELTAEAGGTRVTQSLRAKYLGVSRLFAPFLKGSVQKKLEADLVRLQAAVQNDT